MFSIFFDQLLSFLLTFNELLVKCVNFSLFSVANCFLAILCLFLIGYILVAVFVHIKRTAFFNSGLLGNLKMLLEDAVHLFL